MANPVPAAPTPSGFANFEIKDYLEILRRRRVPVILCAVGFFAFSIVFSLRQANYYRSETLIMVDPQQVPSNYVQSTVNMSIQDRLSTIQEQVMSSSRLQHIIDSLGLYPNLKGKKTQQEIIQVMRKATTVELVNPGEHRLSSFRIAFQASDPKTAAKVANELASQFIDENLRARLDQFNGAADFLESELRSTKEQLEQKEQELQKIKVQNVMDLPESRQYHMEALNNLRAQMRTAQDRIGRAQQQKLMLQQYAPTVDLDASSYGPAVSPIEAQIQKSEGQLSELRARYGPDHPDVRKVESDLKKLRAQEAAEKKQQASLAAPKPPPITPARARNPVLEAENQKLDQEIKEQTDLVNQLQEQINFHTQKLEHGPVFEEKIADLMRDYDNLRAHYSSLVDKKLSAEMARELEGRQQGERFVVLDPAVPAQTPAGPNRIIMSVGGLMLGTLAGFGLILVLEFSDESVRTEREAASLIGEPVLVSVPPVYNKSELYKHRLRLAGAFIGTFAGSVVLGYVVSLLGISLH